MYFDIKSIILSLMLLFSAVAVGSIVEVETEKDLVLKIHELAEGDTLLIKAGVYNINKDNAPDGLYVAGFDFSPYADVVVMGEGRDKTIIDFNDSYGFLASYCDNLLFKDLTIQNAKKNGGIYVFQGTIRVEGITIRNCESKKNNVTGVAGSGGAICVDGSSFLISAKHSIFHHNKAEVNGGAIAILNESTTPNLSTIIDQCQFYANASLRGGALYFSRLRRAMRIDRSVFFDNTCTDAALFLNSSTVLNFRNNSVVNNHSAGIMLGTSLLEQFYFDNNVIINNDALDLMGTSSKGNYFRGLYNVVGTSNDNVVFNGEFNDIVSESPNVYINENDSLKHTIYGAGLLAGRVPNTHMVSADTYGQTWEGLADVGAIKVPLGDSVSIWYAENSDFLDADNWKGLVPNDLTTKKVIVNHCLSSHYPSVTNLVDISKADLIIGPTGALKLTGELKIDTLYIESQNGGTAQFLNDGVLEANARLSEQFLENNLCTPVYFPDTATIVGSVLPYATYEDDYCAQAFNESNLNFVPMLATDTFFQDQGYWITSYKNQTMSYALPKVAKDEFALHYTDHPKEVQSGWNLVGNAFGAPIKSEEMMANVGNTSKVASAVYAFDDGHFKAYVDGVGDVEAKVLMPYKAFYLKALDGADGELFHLDAGDIAIMNADDISAVDLKSEMLKVRLFDKLNEEIDVTYVRFLETSTESFDQATDAYKLDQVFGMASEHLYTQNADLDDVYAINSLPIQNKEVKSIALKLAAPSVDIKSSLSQSLYFNMSNNHDVEYLLHDSKKDSSESVILKNGYRYGFKTGTDSVGLSNRFSLQAFEDTIPFGVLRVDMSSAQGYTLIDRQKLFSFEIAEVERTMLESTALLDNPDTIFYEQIWVDTVYYDSISYRIDYHDSITIDSTISDTLRVLGTYEYVVRNVSTVNTRYTTNDTVYLDTTYNNLRTNEYILFDTALVASNVELEAQNVIQINSLDGGISLRLPNSESARVELYNLSGQMLRSIEVQSLGEMHNLAAGVYILNIDNAYDHWSCKVLVK